MCGEWEHLWRSPREKEWSCWQEVMSTPSSICRQCSNTLLLIERQVISNLNRWIYIVFHVQLHRWHQKQPVYSKISKNLQWWNFRSHLRKVLDSILCVKHWQVFPRLSEKRLGEDGFLSMAALRSLTFLCSKGKLQKFGIPMILVPGIQQGSLPGVLCVSWWETERVWKPTWQVRLYWKIARFLSKCCQNHPILKVWVFLCQVSIFRVKKTQTKKTPEEDNKKIWKVFNQQSAQWPYVAGLHKSPKGGF